LSGGVRPVHTPADVPSLCTVLAGANRERTPLLVQGGGTKQLPGTGTPPAAAILSTLGLTRPLDHCAGDLTATIGAGVTLGAANAELAKAGQWLPLDPPAARHATIGGIVAANDSGPRRTRHGTPRDLIIGVELVRADGTPAKAGGKVVKNVAGYDLARMLCGSYGSLAVITSATFKLSPIAPVSRTLVVQAQEPGACADIALAVAAAPATPSAIEIESPPHRVLVRFETTERAADAQAAQTAALCTSLGGAVTTLGDEADRDLWSAYEAAVWEERRDAAVVKVALLPTDVRDLLSECAGMSIAGRGALGVLYLRRSGPPDEVAAWLQDLRTRLARRGGHAVVVRAPADWPRQLDPWGPPRSDAALMRAVKAQFDPHNILNPGRGPYGL
jgi:glycolate oxidase FAD binding subunit